MKVTIADVVKKSGLSYVTVSRVISNAPNVREKNRKRVLDAIEALGYVPNAAARTLARGKTNVIAMFVMDFSDPFFSAVVRSVNQTLSDYGYLLALSVCSAGASDTNTAFLSQNRVDGVILLVPGMEQYYVQLLNSRNTPFVVVDNQSIGTPITAIQTDNLKGGYLAAKHLLSLGHSRIGLIGAARTLLSSLERQMGAMTALQEASLEPAALYHGDYDIQTGYQAVMQWKDQNILPTAVFAFDDNIALGAINALKDLGLKIPEDVSVCGYDDSPMSSQFVPAITSVRQPASRMGQVAAEQLLNLLKDPESTPVSLRLDPVLAEKASTAPLLK